MTQWPVSNDQAATSPLFAAPWTHRPGSSLLVLFLSKLLITHYLYVTRLMDGSLRDQY